MEPASSRHLFISSWVLPYISTHRPLDSKQTRNRQLLTVIPIQSIMLDFGSRSGKLPSELDANVL
jgi:hypothetical protein